MKIIRFSELVESSWKNGGGITREIANAAIGTSHVWQLSMADVTADGPFSDFSGFVRILTVVKGQGMTLQSDGDSIDAKPWVPVQFSGALKIMGHLKSDPVVNFNLKFNPGYCTGDVTVLHGQQTRSLALDERRQFVVYCLAGSVNLNDSSRLLPGDTAFIGADEGQVTLAHGDAALLVQLDMNDRIRPETLLVTTH